MTTIPIDISYRNGIMPSSFRRDSFAQSQGMGGVSWGGMSVGSWLREEVMLNNLNMPASSHTPSSVSNRPGLSAAVMGSAAASVDRSCDRLDRLVGSERNSRASTPHGHSNSGSHALGGDSLEMTPAYFPSMEVNFCRDYSCCGRPLPTLHDLLKHYEESHVSSTPPAEAPAPRRVSSPEMVSTNEVFLSSQAQLHNQTNAGLGMMNGGSNTGSVTGNGGSVSGISSHIHNNRPTAASGAGVAGSHDQSHQHFMARNNAQMGQTIGHHNVSQGLESLHLHAGLGGPAFGATPHTNGLLGGVQSMDGHHINRGVNGNGVSVKDDDDDLCIDDPARHLYVAERSEAKPYRCPVVGCEKMYKNQNGLKYHRLHGHQNQTLHANEDGTFSIIDPLSNTPYPDGQGMEKDKPYRCEVCGKRYKNLNGLKYHRAHSTH